MLLDWMTKYEPIWLFLILFVETGVGFMTLYWVKREFDYDEQKDLEKKHKRTKTTKKVTTNPGGVSTTEETTEVVEGMSEQKETPK